MSDLLLPKNRLLQRNRKGSKFKSQKFIKNNPKWRIFYRYFSRQGSASLQLDEQGNIVRGGSVSSTKSPSPVLTAPKQVTTMPLDQNGNIRIVDKNRTDAHAFEVRNLLFSGVSGF